MPYIKQKNRDNLDDSIDALAESIAKESEKETDYAGLLNYTCTRLALKVVKIKFGRISYPAVAMLSGVFHNVADEFYRRIASVYEDKKIKENGDVDLYDDILKGMK